jgi:tetratricopeptide (TPR) repeat protein
MEGQCPAGRGDAYRNAGDLNRAFAEYEQALRLDPQHKGAHEYVGEAYVIARNIPKAEVSCILSGFSFQGAFAAQRARPRRLAQALPPAAVAA